MAYEGIYYRGKPYTGTLDRAADTADEEQRRKTAEIIALKAEQDRAPQGIRPEDLGGVGARVLAQARQGPPEPAPLTNTPGSYFLSAKDVPVLDLSEQKPNFTDTNHDGIPDGAEITRTVQHEGPNGEQIKDQMFYTKGTAQNPFQNQRVKMGVDAPQIGGENPFTGKTIMTAEEALGARRDQLAQKAGNVGLSGAERKAAAAEAANLDQRAATAAAEHKYETKVAAVTGREQYKVDQGYAAADRRAQATENAAKLAGTSRETVAGTKAAADLAKTEAQNANRLAVTGLLNEGKLAEANTRAMADKTHAEITAETDRTVAQLNKEGKTDAANILSQNRFKVDPLIWLQSTDEQRKMIMDKILTAGQTTTTGTPAAGSGTTTPPATTAVTGRAPTNDEAKAILSAAGGDKTLAREIAKRRGFTL